MSSLGGEAVVLSLIVRCQEAFAEPCSSADAGNRGVVNFNARLDWNIYISVLNG
jgi:hypothetical protein